MAENIKLINLHNIILSICRDKYAVPEMMAERITKEVDDYIDYHPQPLDDGVEINIFRNTLGKADIFNKVFRHLVRLGVCRKGAQTTPSEVMMALETYLDSQKPLDEEGLREKIENELFKLCTDPKFTKAAWACSNSESPDIVGLIDMPQFQQTVKNLSLLSREGAG